MSEEIVVSFVVPVVLLLVGIGLLITAAHFRAQTHKFLAGARESKGVVVALQRQPPQQDESDTFAPVVAFTGQDGSAIQFTSQASSSPPRYAVGARVPVLYSADRPAEARIRSFHELWFAPTLCGGLGLVFTAVGLGLLTGAIPL